MEEITTDNAPSFEAAPLSQATKVGNTIYVSGQLGIDPQSEELVSSDVQEQTKQTIENIAAVLEAAGASLDDIVNTTVFLSDLKHYDDVNEVYSESLSEPYPSRSAIEVGDLVLDGDVEIEVIAHKDD
ncbi:Rid family detoxifying hydrolase [Haloplanus sp. GCM10025708]|uniref:Rid family detoxifying hydrolase n=1 Tax=Haloferacaceae TaxID=1644056 RepID=UPI00362287CF